MDSQGAVAVFNGLRAQTLVKQFLLLGGYQHSPARFLTELQAQKGSLYDVTGQFADQCKVPLVAPYHQGRNRMVTVDFVILAKSGDVILLSVKSQRSDGSADEKLEFEVQQLIATELPAAMIVLGPIQGRDGPTGWRPAVLGEIWERARYYGSNRVLLFRTGEKLSRWIQAGMPVGGRGVTNAQIFAEYCDREP